MKFLFCAYNKTFKDVNWFIIPNLNLKFVYIIPFVYAIWKNALLQDFVLVETGLIIVADDDFNK